MGSVLSAEAIDPPAAKTSVSFLLNKEQIILEGASPLLSLNDWLRAQPGYGGTKIMCGEGGCGCCVVAASIPSGTPPLCDDEDGWELLDTQDSTIAINSVRTCWLDLAYSKYYILIQCLCPLYAIDGWHITTIEGIGR